MLERLLIDLGATYDEDFLYSRVATQTNKRFFKVTKDFKKPVLIISDASD